MCIHCQVHQIFLQFFCKKTFFLFLELHNFYMFELLISYHELVLEHIVACSIYPSALDQLHQLNNVWASFWYIISLFHQKNCCIYFDSDLWLLDAAVFSTLLQTYAFLPNCQSMKKHVYFNTSLNLCISSQLLINKKSGIFCCNRNCVIGTLR